MAGEFGISSSSGAASVKPKAPAVSAPPSTTNYFGGQQAGGFNGTTGTVIPRTGMNPAAAGGVDYGAMTDQATANQQQAFDLAKYLSDIGAQGQRAQLDYQQNALSKLAAPRLDQGALTNQAAVNAWADQTRGSLLNTWSAMSPQYMQWIANVNAATRAARSENQQSYVGQRTGFMQEQTGKGAVGAAFTGENLNALHKAYLTNAQQLSLQGQNQVGSIRRQMTEGYGSLGRELASIDRSRAEALARVQDARTQQALQQSGYDQQSAQLAGQYAGIGPASAQNALQYAQVLGPLMAGMPAGQAQQFQFQILNSMSGGKLGEYLAGLAGPTSTYSHSRGMRSN